MMPDERPPGDGEMDQDAYDAWFRAEVQKGIDDFAAGRVSTHEQVKEYFRAMGLDIA
jgi:predicted transcriptional regulator